MKITNEQVTMFRSIFRGRADAYGTYDPRSKRVWQSKRPVTDHVIRAHLEGRAPFGVYLLDTDRVWVAAADFDDPAIDPPREFVRISASFGLPTQIERSKSKGYHVWLFFEAEGVKAWQVRLVIRHILKMIGKPKTEVFPKQDHLGSRNKFGNFINCPLFGSLVPQNRSVFVEESDFQPFADQWRFLKSLRRINAEDLYAVIKAKKLFNRSRPKKLQPGPQRNGLASLTPCAQRILAAGVTENQRVVCFRLACQLRKIGFPFELAVSTLIAWSQRNRPRNGKSIIRPSEVRSQTRYAYDGQYRSFGCEDPAISPFCEPDCPIHSTHIRIGNQPELQEL